VVVNIPAFRADVYVGDSVVRSFPVAVGMRGFDTPRGSYAISSIEWNPWWSPPDRPWAAKQRPTPPGPANPMGRVKLNFRPLYFLHGTPLEHSIGSAASHGCIRLRNADALMLAELVQRAGSPTMTEHEIAVLLADTQHSRTIRLERPVALELRYDRVEIRNGVLTVYRDVYGIGGRPLREQVLTALGQHGVDVSRVDSARVSRLIGHIDPKGNAIELDRFLVRPPALTPPARR
jgi:murein L,D-transpeptidase YcbB/YkuD